MKWSRELRIARRSLRTALRAVSVVARTRLPPAPATSRNGPDVADRRLVEITDFGSNPGRLAMFAYQPPDPPAVQAPLIVLLHGCGQSAERFVIESGWMRVANRLGIPLVLPEQGDENNRGRCFNWFRPMHTSRDHGETLSIRQMVATATKRFGSDPRLVFVAGLSAGGAMAAALLAAYPDVFAGGAVVAGLPVGAASSAAEALRRMAEADAARPAAAWAERVRRAAPIAYAGPWPRITIWHGDADGVVDPANARLLATQWTAVHGLAALPSDSVELSGMRRDRWNRADRPIVELCSLRGHGHDWPTAATSGIAEFWDLPRG
jgi:poly(hydroxyalkanoate) depolymerase family esterase